MEKSSETPMNKILLLTDFSENARNAALFAINAFDPDQFKFILLNSYDRIYTTTEVTFSLSEQMHIQSQENLSKEADLLRQRSGTNILFEKFSFLGFLSEAVNQTALTKKPDLVVMGTKGETGLPAILIGSHASSLIKAINLPLLIVPEKATFTGLKNIVLAADEQTILKPHHLEPLVQLAGIFDSRIQVVNVYKDEKHAPSVHGDQGKTLIDQFPGNMAEIHYIQDAHKGHGLARFTHSHPCDLVVLVERSRNFIVDLFHRSLSKNLALHLDIPLLVLHD